MEYFTKSKIFLYFCLSFASGIFIASFLKIPDLTLFAAAIIVIIFISIFWREKRLVVAGFCIIFAILGVYRLQSAAEEKSFISWYNDLPEEIVLEGIIIEEPDIRIKDVQYVVRINQKPKTKNQNFGVSQGETKIDSQGKNLGKILVTLPHYPAYQYGDLIEMEGKLKTPAEFDSFSYKDYLAKDGVCSVMYSPQTKFISSGSGNFIYSLIFSFKNEFKDRLKKLLPEPEISLLGGLLLGDRSGMAEKLKNDFSITGTSHIVAVSGFNVTIIAFIILELSLLLGFSRNQSFWVSFLAIIFFVIMVGAPASAIRAGIMGGLTMVAMRAGRINAISTAIVFAAALMIAINPKILRFDAGFQLSFLAVVGIVWVYPILDYYFRKLPDILKAKSMLLVTISAQIMALPILIYNFDQLSLIASLANILILPFIPMAMAFGFLAGFFTFIWFLPAKIIGYFAWFILTYQIRAIEFLASVPWASVKINDLEIAFCVIYYVIIALIIFANKKRTARFAV